ncbi:MAG: hypothetical protein ACJA0H_002094, partial [Francisellaceae bacterium]
MSFYSKIELILITFNDVHKQGYMYQYFNISICAQALCSDLLDGSL